MIVFTTPGSLDINSLLVFGLSAKETANPIGYFGTGLKYAVAVLAREDISIRVYTDGDTWEISKASGTFRGRDFQGIRLTRANGQQIDLPFTTELGKNWELWQAFRELEANTRDERGRTERPELLSPTEGFTYICVGTKGDKFEKIWLTSSEIFLPEHLIDHDGSGVQVILRPSRYLYYRGLRVMDLEHPALFTYNVLSEIRLTEDRTAAWSWEVNRLVAEYWSQMEKSSPRIFQVLGAKEDAWEHRLDWTSAWNAPSEEWLSAFRGRKAAGLSTRDAAQSYADRYAPKEDLEKKPLVEVLLGLAEEEDWYALQTYISSHAAEFIQLLKDYKAPAAAQANEPDRKLLHSLSCPAFTDPTAHCNCIAGAL